MSGILKNITKGVLSLAILLSTPTFAEDYERGEGYDGRNSGLKTGLDYAHIIGENKKNNPQQPGESDGAYAVRMARVDPSYVPPNPNDSANPNGGTVDRSEKLADAYQLALEGESSAAASTAALVSDLVNGSFPSTPGATPMPGSDLGKIGDAMAKFGAIAGDMQTAWKHNQAGKIRLLADGDDASAGTPGKAFAAAVAAQLPDDVKDKLAKKGMDADEVVERLLSGETDLKDPNDILKALGIERKIAVSDLPEGLPLAETSSLGDERVAGRGLRTGDDPEGKEGRGTVVKDGSEKGKDVDTSEFNKKTGWLGGLPISIMNREVMGYRIGDFLGMKKTPKGNGEGPEASEAFKAKNRAAKGRKGVLAKTLTPVERYQLQDKGVTTVRKGSTIFQVAHRQYRDFNKWREKKARRGRVAQN